MVPQLNVIGSFTFVSNKKDPAGEAIEAPMPFNDGTYDVSTGTIVMTVVSENMGNIVVNCRVESTDVLDCRWLSRDAIEFKLKKVK